jgi:hypothetical protein
MSNLIINIRFWYWHLQISKKFYSIKWVKNQYYVENGLTGIKKIEVCEWKIRNL